MRLRWMILLCLVLMPLMGGCAAHSLKPGKLAKVQPVSDASRAGNAYLLRGFIGIFSTGMDQLNREIRAAGVRSYVFQDDQWPRLAKRIIEEYREVEGAEPLILIGHSYGADDVIRIARELNKANIPIDLLVTLDPVTPPPIPPNVRYTLNLYQSHFIFDKLPVLRGVAVRQEVPGSGLLDNFDIRNDRRDLLEARTDHFNIEKKQRIHEEVVGYVIMTCPPRPNWLAMQRQRGSEPSIARSTANEPAEAQQAGHRMGD